MASEMEKTKYYQYVHNSRGIPIDIIFQIISVFKYFKRKQ